MWIWVKRCIFKVWIVLLICDIKKIVTILYKIEPKITMIGVHCQIKYVEEKLKENKINSSKSDRMCMKNYEVK